MAAIIYLSYTLPLNCPVMLFDPESICIAFELSLLIYEEILIHIHFLLHVAIFYVNCQWPVSALGYNIFYLTFILAISYW